MKLFDPKSIAVIGASADPLKLGYQILHKLLKSDCRIYPVNPSRKKISGLICYPSIDSIPETVDQAVIVTPAATVPAIIKDCLIKKVDSIVIISAGFSESGPAGSFLEGQIIKTSGKILGPNCFGYANPEKKLDLSFAKTPPPQGNIALITQSGAIGSFLFDWAKAEHLGFSKFVSFGNRLDINENSLLEYLMNDPATKVIGLYLESFADGAKFLKIASRVNLLKPLIVLFGGQTQAGKKAALSHTASLSPETAVITTALHQTGCLEAKSLEEFTDLLEIFSLEPPLTDNDLVIITNAGGPGILATDTASQVKLDVDRPLDLLGDAMADRFVTAFNQVIKDKVKDAFLVILTPQSGTQLELTCQAVVDQFKQLKKPVVVSLLGGAINDSAKEILRRNKIATIDFPQNAVKYLSLLYEYWHQHRFGCLYPIRQAKVKQFAKLKLNSGLLSWQQSRQLSNIYHLKLIQTVQIRSDSFSNLIKILGWPLVLKSDPSEAIHRTENKALYLNINSLQALKSAYKKLSETYKTVLAQPQIKIGHELFIGISRPPGFPPLLTLGSGGIYTEIYQDVVHYFLPVNIKIIKELLLATKIGQILAGVRGAAPVDLKPVINLILNLSHLVFDYPQIQTIDINPLIVSQNQAVVVDIKITIEPARTLLAG